MSKLFEFKVVTPERVFYSDKVEMITINTLSGEMGIMADHVPMLIANKICTLKIITGKTKKYASISEGFTEVTPDKVTLIVDTAEWADEIDIDRAITAKKSAEEKLVSNVHDSENKLKLKVSIERANNRIKTAGINNHK